MVNLLLKAFKLIFNNLVFGFNFLHFSEILFFLNQLLILSHLNGLGVRKKRFVDCFYVGESGFHVGERKLNTDLFIRFLLFFNSILFVFFIE